MHLQLFFAPRHVHGSECGPSHTTLQWSLVSSVSVHLVGMAITINSSNHWMHEPKHLVFQWGGQPNQPAKSFPDGHLISNVRESPFAIGKALELSCLWMFANLTRIKKKKITFLCCFDPYFFNYQCIQTSFHMFIRTFVRPWIHLYPLLCFYWK